MAVTNRARGAEKTPAWAARGKLRLAFVPGGPTEAAVAVHSGSWNCDPAVLYKHCTRYGPELVDELVAKKVNAVVLTWSHGLSAESDRAQRAVLAKILPLLKKKKIRAIASILSGMACEADLKAHDAKALQWALQAEQPIKGVLRLDTNNPELQKRAIDDATAAIDAGFEGLFFEDMAGNVEPLRSVTAAARARLTEGSPGLVISSNNLFEPAMSALGNLKFRRGGRTPGFQGEKFSSNIAELKFIFESGGRDKVFASRTRCDGPATQSGGLAAAEILACGGACYDESLPDAWLQFMEAHSDFSSGDPVNAVGILVSDGDDYRGNLPECAPFLNALTLASVQFDVIPVSQFGAFEMRKYRVISATHLQHLMPEVFEALRVFATEHGGTVLAGSQTGTLAADGSPAERPAWLKAFSGTGREEGALGKGRVIHFSHAAGDLGSAEQPPSDTLVSSVAADLLKCGENPLECSAPKGVVCLLWGRGTRRWVHVLNYTGSPADATISLPGCGGRKLQVFSPDATAPELSIVESGSAKAVFQLKNVTTYAVVEVV